MIPEWADFGGAGRALSAKLGATGRRVRRRVLRGSYVSVVETAEVGDRDDLARSVVDGSWRRRVAIEGQVHDTRDQVDDYRRRPSRRLAECRNRLVVIGWGVGAGLVSVGK